MGIVSAACFMEVIGNESVSITSFAVVRSKAALITQTANNLCLIMGVDVC